MTDLTSTNPSELIVGASLPLDQNPAAVYLASLSPTGRRSQKQALDVMAGMLTGNADCLTMNWADLRFQHTAAIRAALVEKYRPATVNKCLCAIRKTLKAAWRLGQMTNEEYSRAADVESVSGETIPAGRELTSGEIGALMANCENDPTPAGGRDAAIIALMYSCGLRREEVVSLSLASYDSESGQLVVHGKRNKERTAYLVNGAADAMADWLKIRGYVDDPLFCAINKGGRLDPGKAMSPQAVYNLLAKRAGLSGVKDFSPHDIRRTFVSDLLDAGADIATVSKMAGHASVNTTARYDRRPEEAKRKAAGLLHIPYRRRAS
jgi:integrase/recombinase XerD